MPKVNVADPNEEPLELHYLLYGTGPQHILLINGLGGIGQHWESVAEYFAELGDYTACLFDNRGVGFSSTPPGPYTTQLMARDASRLLDHLGWEHVHLVGVSLGGMIAQELALMLGDKVLSLTLESTYAKFRGVPLPMLWVSLFGGGYDPKDLRARARFLSTMMFTAEWLAAPSKADPAVSNHDAIAEYLFRMSEKYGAQSEAGRSAQSRAAVMHYCDKRLDEIRERGYPVLVIAGDNDRILRQPSGCAYLAKRLGARFEIYKGGGHVLFLQDPEWHNALLLETVRKGHERWQAKAAAEASAAGAAAAAPTAAA